MESRIEFYLGRPVLVTPDYRTFAGLADGLVAGRRVVLLRRD